MAYHFKLLDVEFHERGISKLILKLRKCIKLDDNYGKKKYIESESAVCTCIFNKVMRKVPYFMIYSRTV